MSQLTVEHNLQFKALILRSAGPGAAIDPASLSAAIPSVLAELRCHGHVIVDPVHTPHHIIAILIGMLTRAGIRATVGVAPHALRMGIHQGSIVVLPAVQHAPVTFDPQANFGNRSGTRMIQHQQQLAAVHTAHTPAPFPGDSGAIGNRSGSGNRLVFHHNPLGRR